jgi:phage repressor protein C with HTH and peptisase S24 domain
MAETNRIRELREARGWTLEHLARTLTAKIGEEVTLQRIHRYETNKVELPRKWASRIADALGVGMHDLFAEEIGTSSVPLVGYVGAGEKYYPDPMAGEWGTVEKVDAPPGSKDVVAVRVKGSSMEPVYRNGDLIYFKRKDGEPVESSLNSDCVVETKSGAVYIKRLGKGTQPGRYHLYSYSPDVVTMGDTEVVWASKVLWVKRI